MRYDEYLYNETGGSESDFVIKIYYGNIMENVFRGSKCRLGWYVFFFFFSFLFLKIIFLLFIFLIYSNRGETKSPTCKKKSNKAKLDVRIISKCMFKLVAIFLNSLPVELNIVVYIYLYIYIIIILIITSKLHTLQYLYF